MAIEVASSVDPSSTSVARGGVGLAGPVAGPGAFAGAFIAIGSGDQPVQIERGSTDLTRHVDRDALRRVDAVPVLAVRIELEVEVAPLPRNQVRRHDAGPKQIHAGQLTGDDGLDRVAG